MSKVELDKAYNNLTKKIQEDEKLNSAIMVYHPFSEGYWDVSPKIVFCNYENYGYTEDKYKKNEVLLSFREFFLWISGYWIKQKISFDEFYIKTNNCSIFIPDDEKEKKSKPNKTAKKSLILVNVLLDKLKNKHADIRSIKKYSSTKLSTVLTHFTYMNLRPTSGSKREQDTLNTQYWLFSYHKYIKQIILALEADIFVLSTEHAVTLFNNYIFKDEVEQTGEKLIFKNHLKIGKTHFFSIVHPSCRYFTDEYLTKVVDDILFKYAGS